jgi:hypothetical protein
MAAAAGSAFVGMKARPFAAQAGAGQGKIAKEA